jgi:type II secretory pathway pseudopilin PulG
MTRIFNKSKAFTLVELALVIGIIGQLAAFAITESMSMMGDVEEAMLDNYYQQLQNGYAQYVAEMGKRPKRFEDFVAFDQASLDPENGKAVTLVYDQNNRRACSFNHPHVGDNNIGCTGGSHTNAIPHLRNIAVYRFDSNGGLVYQKQTHYRP